MGRFAVALSGGVDSAVAAALVQRQGHEVLGITMIVLASDSGPTPSAVRDAEAVCRHLGIAHHVVDFQQEFARSVVGPFLEEYARGRTPNPCARCNSSVKFGLLVEAARSLGAEALVTGHHARLRSDPVSGRVRLLRGRDPRKDQSYFLACLTQQQLGMARFPVGEMDKARVRSLAGTLGLEVAEKADSQDLCFVPGDDTAAFLESRLVDSPGAIRDEGGRVLGTHRGLHRFTVGQRRGLGLRTDRPVYVLSLDPAGNSLVVGPAERLLVRQIELEGVHWLVEEAVGRARVQYRSTHRGELARLHSEGCGRMTVRFGHPQRSLAPGQLAVFYRRDEVLGHGTIRGPLPERPGKGSDPAAEAAGSAGEG